MAETKNQNNVEKAPEKTPENPRKAIREARAKRLRVIDGPPKTIKVYAANEALRGALRHSNGTRFRSGLDQAVEWPNDNFTHRRIADGSVLTDAPGSAESKPVDETLNAREQAAVNKPKKTTKQDTKSAPKSASPAV
jgi:hypothetical protein